MLIRDSTLISHGESWNNCRLKIAPISIFQMIISWKCSQWERVPGKCRAGGEGRRGRQAGIPSRAGGSKPHPERPRPHRDPGGTQPHRDPGGTRSPELPTAALGSSMPSRCHGQRVWGSWLRVCQLCQLCCGHCQPGQPCLQSRPPLPSAVPQLQQDLYLSIGSLFHHSNIIMC